MRQAVIQFLKKSPKQSPQAWELHKLSHFLLPHRVVALIDLAWTLSFLSEESWRLMLGQGTAFMRDFELYPDILLDGLFIGS